MITFYDIDVVGMQEVLKHQIMDLEQYLVNYQWVGLGRDDGKEKGEFCPIFFNKDRLEILENATFWLSETCEVPGKMGWDAACNRVVTWAKFKDKTDQSTFYLFNTHFDHRGEIARRESAKLLLQKVKEIADKQPVIVTGDFNGNPNSQPYQIITTSKNALKDAFNISQTPHFGQVCTFSGFKPIIADSDRRIDYIFVNESVAVLKHAILTDSWGGRFPSDHFPVFSKVMLKSVGTE